MIMNKCIAFIVTFEVSQELLMAQITQVGYLYHYIFISKLRM